MTLLAAFSLTWEQVEAAVVVGCASLVVIVPLVIGTFIKLLPQLILLKKAIEQLTEKNEKNEADIKNTNSILTQVALSTPTAGDANIANGLAAIKAGVEKLTSESDKKNES